MTPHLFRQLHGDPAAWVSAEFEEYLDSCDAYELDLALTQEYLDGRMAMTCKEHAAETSEYVAKLKGGAA